MSGCGSTVPEVVLIVVKIVVMVKVIMVVADAVIRNINKLLSSF